jgi:hypothetical protein
MNIHKISYQQTSKGFDEGDVKLDMEWARKNIIGFAKYADKVKAVKMDEQRYKDRPGYVPE